MSAATTLTSAVSLQAVRLAAGAPRGARADAVAAAAGAMRQLWLDAAASARAAGREPVMLPEVLWPELADVALIAAAPLLTPPARRRDREPLPAAAQGRQLAAALPGAGDDQLEAAHRAQAARLAGALRDRDCLTVALQQLLDQLADVRLPAAVGEAAADAAELLDDLAHDPESTWKDS